MTNEQNTRVMETIQTGVKIILDKNQGQSKPRYVLVLSSDVLDFFSEAQSWDGENLPQLLGEDLFNSWGYSFDDGSSRSQCIDADTIPTSAYKDDPDSVRAYKEAIIDYLYHFAVVLQGPPEYQPTQQSDAKSWPLQF